MSDVKLKDIALVLTLITGFVFMISLASFYTYALLQHGDFCTCTEQIPLIIIIVASSGLFVGSFAYYLLIDRIVRRYRTKKDLESALKPIVQALGRDEALLLRVLIQKKELRQSELCKLTGLSRVKVTRLLKKLEGKGVIERRRIGKIKIVRLSSSA